MEEKIFSEIRKIISDKFSKKVTKETKFKDTGIDSLDLLDLVIVAEEKYGVKIDDSELLSISTVEDIVKILSSRINK